MEISGKIVAITGASSGIGRATAKLLAEKGAHVVLAARREAELRSVRAEIEGAGGKAFHCVVDVRRREDMQRLVDSACEHFGGLDVLVSNAGIGPISRFDALAVADWEDMIDVNIKGVLYGIAAALPHFSRQNSGQFIHILSTAGLRILPTMGVYAATKNAVRTLTEALRQEVGPRIRVTEISPGMVATEFTATISDETTRKAIDERMHGVAIAPDAIARAVAFAIGQPADVDVGSIVVRPTAQD